MKFKVGDLIEPKRLFGLTKIQFGIVLEVNMMWPDSYLTGKIHRVFMFEDMIEMYFIDTEIEKVILHD